GEVDPEHTPVGLHRPWLHLATKILDVMLYELSHCWSCRQRSELRLLRDVHAVVVRVQEPFEVFRLFLVVAICPLLKCSVWFSPDHSVAVSVFERSFLYCRHFYPCSRLF